jgi:ABC-type uncharacterized transport system fused permease/ATPase subunit
MGPDYKMQDIDENQNILSSLLDSMEDYGKTNFDLAKLKALDKASEMAATLLSRVVTIIAYLTFILMASTGLAFWLGSVLGGIWYGFFVVAAFYGLLGLIITFFMHKGLKRMFADLIIKDTLK